MPTALDVRFSMPQPDVLDVSIDAHSKWELLTELRQAIEAFQLMLPVSNGRKSINQSWSFDSLLVRSTEQEVLRKGEIRLRFNNRVKTHKKAYAEMIEAIKELIIGVCTNCGLFNDVSVVG